MKKITVVMTIAAVVASASMAFAGAAPKTGINGSMHDINKVAGGYQKDSLLRTCAFCHTPHNALPNGSVPAPLWNHAPSTVNLAPYTWAAPTNQGIAFNSDPLVGPSRLCMACHDGVAAVDSHGSAASSPTGTKKMTSSYVDGLGNTAKRYITDLTVTHPIGFLWDDAATARGSEIVPKTNSFITDNALGYTASSNNSTFDTRASRASITSGKKIQDTLYSGYMTCATCHDVHNSVNASPAAGQTYNYFLYAQEEGSAICLSCHVK
jgi:cytochrome c553